MSIACLSETTYLTKIPKKCFFFFNKIPFILKISKMPEVLPFMIIVAVLLDTCSSLKDLNGQLLGIKKTWETTWPHSSTLGAFRERLADAWWLPSLLQASGCLLLVLVALLFLVLRAAYLGMTRSQEKPNEVSHNQEDRRLAEIGNTEAKHVLLREPHTTPKKDSKGMERKEKVARNEIEGLKGNEKTAKYEMEKIDMDRKDYIISIRTETGPSEGIESDFAKRLKCELQEMAQVGMFLLRHRVMDFRGEAEREAMYEGNSVIAAEIEKLLRYEKAKGMTELQ